MEKQYELGIMGLALLHLAVTLASDCHSLPVLLICKMGDIVGCTGTKWACTCRYGGVCLACSMCTVSASHLSTPEEWLHVNRGSP